MALQCQTEHDSARVFAGRDDGVSVLCTQARQISTDVAPVSSGLRATDSFASSEVLSEATSDGLGDDSCIAYPAEDILEKQEDGCDLSSSSDEEDVAQEADETDEAESDSHDSSLASDQAPAPEDSLGARSLQACCTALCSGATHSC